MKNRLLKTFTSLVLVALMVISVMPAFAITIGAAEGDTYKLVTDASTLAVGDTVIIVATDSAVAMSTTQNANNRGQTAVTKSDDKITNIGDDVQVFTLEDGTQTDTFAFYVKGDNGGYLYAAGSGSGKNYLRTQTENNDNGSWKIEITEAGVATIKAQGTNTNNLLKKNSSSSLFSCYSSGQKDVSIYKLVENAEETCDHVPSSDTTTLEYIAEKPATCTTSGTSAGYKCSVCKAVLDGGLETIDPLGHDEVHHDAQAATCTQVGWDAYVTCTRCDYTTYVEIPKTAHTYENGVCSVCNEIEPVKVEFDYETGTNGTVAADVEENSVSLAFSKGTGSTAPTWYSSGTAIRFYQNNTLTISTTKEGYYIKSITFTFTQGAFSADTGSITSGTWTPNADSKPISVVFTNTSSTQARVNYIVVELAPTCLHEKTEAIGEAKAATCTEDGITAGIKCSDCGKTIEEQTTIPATGHKDENSDGKCDVCNTSMCAEHAWKDEILMAATCTTAGKKQQVCENCGEVGETSAIPATGHNEVIDKAVAATCTETGLTEGSHCSVCGEILIAQTTVDKIGHTEVIDEAVAATCTTTGLTEGSHCSVCNTVIKPQTVTSKTSHNDTNNDGICDICKDKVSTYIKVTTDPVDWSGEYLIVYENGNVAFNGSLTELDAASNTVSVTIADNKITGNFSANTFTIAAVDGGYSIQSKSGYYIGQTSDANGLATSTTTVYTNTISLNSDGSVAITSGEAYLRFNSASNQQRFRYYKSTSYTSQKAITLYKLNSGSGSESTTPETEPSIKSVGLSLNKGVTVKVTFDIPDIWLIENPGAKVVFSNGTTIDAKAGVTVYSVDLTPAQINDALTVKIQLADGSDFGATNDVSVSAYKAKVEAAYASGKLSYTEEKYNALIALLNAALTYSNAADGAIAEGLTNEFTGVDDPTVVHGKEDESGNTAENDKLFTGFAGQLGTYASIYINVNTANVQDGETLVLTVGGTEIINGENIADYITKDKQIVISGLYPANFDDTIYIEATNEGSMAEFSFNSYLKAIFNNNSSNQQVKNLAVATYLYGLAAEAYLDTLQ